MAGFQQIRSRGLHYGRGHAQPLECLQGQSLSPLAVGAGAFIDWPALLQAKESLNLPDDLPASTLRIEDLIEEAKESPTQSIDTSAAVGPLIGLSQKARWQQGGQESFKLTEGLLTEVVNAWAQGS